MAVLRSDPNSDAEAEAVSKLLAANASVNPVKAYNNNDLIPMEIACVNGHLGVVQSQQNLSVGVASWIDLRFELQAGSALEAAH